MKHVWLVSLLLLVALTCSSTLVAQQSNERREANPDQRYYLRIENNSIWLVSFRVKAAGSWSGWKNVNPNQSGSLGGSTYTIDDVEVQWKDGFTWKEYNGGTPVIFHGTSYSGHNTTTWTVSGDLLNRIDIN